MRQKLYNISKYSTLHSTWNSNKRTTKRNPYNEAVQMHNGVFHAGRTTIVAPINKLQRFPFVFMMDANNKTNPYGMPLLNIVDIACFNISFVSIHKTGNLARVNMGSECVCVCCEIEIDHSCQ